MFWQIKKICFESMKYVQFPWISTMCNHFSVFEFSRFYEIHRKMIDKIVKNICRIVTNTKITSKNKKEENYLHKTDLMDWNRYFWICHDRSRVATSFVDNTCSLFHEKCHQIFNLNIFSKEIFISKSLNSIKWFERELHFDHRYLVRTKKAANKKFLKKHTAQNIYEN